MHTRLLRPQQTVDQIAQAIGLLNDDVGVLRKLVGQCFG
jgi:hypothetical protein